MIKYSEFRPTAFDPKGLGLNDQQQWLVATVFQNRDSDALERSNFVCFLKAIGGENADAQLHRFGHWGPGWFEIIIINPAKAELVKKAEELEASLENYPVLDEEHYSNLEMAEANEVWRDCYGVKERLKYMRENRSQFEFRDFKDMLRCVRGNYFAGYASELLH